jgi:DNA adenine methylase
MRTTASNNLSMIEIESHKVKTPFRYPGGKFYALKYLLPYLDSIEHDEYREPFVGGGSVFFGKSKARYNWINDVFEELVNIYRFIQDKNSFEDFKSMLLSETADKDRYAEIKKFEPRTDLERAYKYYYLNRTSFSGKLISPAWGYREKRSIPPHRWGEVLDPSHAKLAGTKITSLDFDRVIKAKPKGKSVLIYLDPPYFVPPKTKHYVNGFNYEDHVRLADSLRNSEHSFILSYEDCEGIRDLYNWAHIYKYSFPYRVGDSKTAGGKRLDGKEVIITNRIFSDHKEDQLA